MRTAVGGTAEQVVSESRNFEEIAEGIVWRSAAALYRRPPGACSAPGEPYFPGRLESAIREVKDLSAFDIVHAVLDDVRAFADPIDDLSLVVIKKLSS